MRRLAIIFLLAAMAMGTRAAITAGAGMDSVEISFVNVYPGSSIYELEGHSALRVKGQGVDVAVNFGLFDFYAPNFVYRFVKGQTDYFVGVSYWQNFLSPYRAQGRRVVEHRLDLDSLQKTKLLELLDWQTQPENRVYRYNYVKDNCATRPLRLVELAAGDTLMLGHPDLSEADTKTFRSVMRHYHRNYPWYQFGIDLALGAGIDYPITNREASFAPVVLDMMLTDATVGGRSLVGESTVINDVAPDAAVEGPTPWLLTPMAVGVVVLLIALCLTIKDIKRKKPSRWFDTVFYSTLGLAGLLLTFLIFVSVHEATSPNWLFLWINPLCLFPAIFIWIKKCKTAVFCYQIANFATLLAFCLLLPVVGQSANPAFWPFIIADAMRAALYVYLYRPHEN